MARSTPTVHDTTLLFYAEGQAISIVVGSAQWFEWLRRETTTIFSFHTHNASYTARKERAGNRRGEWYWKAYRTYQGKLYRVYMGKSEDLTLTRLHEIMQTLSSRIHEQAKQTPRMKDHLSVPANQQAYDDTVAMNQYPPRTEAVGPLLETRFHPPRLPPLLVERSRLLTLLDDGQQQKLTLVHAPAGFGKTTLITQWIAYRKHLADASQHAPAPVAWISLDSGDNDPIRFWSTVITACQAFHTSSGQTALTHLSQTSRSPFSSAPLETALAYLLNDLEHSASLGVLILEDYHLIEHKRIHETMAFFIEHVPPSLHIMILTRSEPPMPLVRWRARGNLLEISSNHLRFSIEDTASFLQQALPQAFSQAAVHPLHTHLEGWPAGLRLLLLSLQGHQTSQALEDALSELTTAVEAHQMHRSIQEFFLEEIFNAQPEALRVFLLQTSVLSRLTGSLCDAVTGTQDGAEWLNMIERSGFFLEALDSTGQWYRYHALWAATLRAEAARHLGSEALRDLQLAASHWYAEHAMPVEAIEAALAALEFERAAHLIMQLNARSYFSEYHTMQRWIEQLPVPLLRAQPTLCFLLAQARLFSEENTGPQWRIETVADVLQMAEEGWRQQDDLFQLGILSAFRATFTLVHGHIARGAAYARQALQLLPPPETERPYDKLPAEWIEWHCGCLMALGMEASQAGAFTRAYLFLLEAFTLSLHKEDRVFTRIMGWLLGDVCSEMGRLHQAASFYQQTLAEPPAQDPKGESILRANSLAGLIRIAYEWNALEKAEQMIHEASLYEYRDDFSYGEASVRTRIELFRIILLSTHGERAAVHAALSALIVRLQANPHSLQLTFDVLLYQARLQIRDADLEGVESTLRMLDAGTQDLLPLQQEARQLLQARLHLAHNEANKAQPLLTHLLIEARARQHLVRELEIHLLIALAHFACKQRPEAHQHLSHVLAQARNEGFVRMFLDEGAPLAALLRSLLPKLIENSQRTYVQTILQAFTNPEPKNKPGQPLLEPLSTQEQRVLALLVAGRSNPEIAETLIISVNTVKGHVKNLYRKLDVTNRMEASEVARRLKLI